MKYGVGVVFDGKAEKFNTSFDPPDKEIDINTIDREALTTKFYEGLPEMENHLPVPLIRLGAVLIAQEVEQKASDKEFIDAPKAKKTGADIIFQRDFFHYFEPIVESMGWQENQYDVLDKDEFTEACFEVPKFAFGEVGSEGQYVCRALYKGIDNYKSSTFFVGYRGPDSPTQDILWWGQCSIMMADFPPLDRAKLFDTFMNRRDFDFDFVKFQREHRHRDTETRTDNKRHAPRKVSRKR